MKRIKVKLYMRDACKLCKDAYYLLLWLNETYPLEIEQIDIASDPELELRYTLEIPVIEVENEMICMGIVREEALREKLEEVSNRMR
jgi:hypothetical protein